jgi:hypothetical protein
MGEGMDGAKSASGANTLILVLRASLNANGAPAFGQVVLYTSFGVVKARTGVNFGEELRAGQESLAQDGSQPDVIALYDATVEHYSNHLPTASFDRLYVRLADVQSFALVGSPSK